VSVTSPILVPPLLLATDGSTGARAAQKLLYPIVRVVQPATGAAARSPIIVLTVCPRRSSRATGPLGRISRKSAKSLPVAEEPAATPKPEHLIQQVLAEFPADLLVESQIRQGRPATEILTYARSVEAGLIAVGNRGTGGVRELLLGSVSSVIARYAPCSVLVARGKGCEEGQVPALTHGLLVVQEAQGRLTRSTQGAIALLRQLIPAGICQVTILYVQSPLNVNYLFGPFSTPTPSWQLSQSLQQAQKEQADQVLQQAASALSHANLSVQSLLQTGDAGPVICQVAQKQSVDWMILGSGLKRRSLPAPWQGLRKRRSPTAGDTQPTSTALRNTRLSSTEDYVIHHAPCPVFLCRIDS